MKYWIVKNKTAKLFSLWLLVLLLTQATVPVTVLADDKDFSTPLPPHKPIIVFDLDRTLFNIDGRVAAIMQAVGITSITTADARSRTSAFGRLFYYDASYLIHDTAFVGAPEFVETLSKTIGVSILYLSGRLKNDFQQATVEQLSRHGFPSGLLVLKPQDSIDPLSAVSTHVFKSRILQDLRETNPIVAIFDDSKRNVQEFRSVLDVETLIVYISTNSPASNHASMLPGIHTVDDLATHAAVLVNKAQSCAQLLLEK